jgi:hypothetical protein
LDTRTILEKLSELRAHDPGCSYFGARVHQYVLNPPLTISCIQDFEAKYHCTLPGEYRSFLAEVGNGGAGPNYGLFPLGCVHHLRTLEPWNDAEDIGDLSAAFPYTVAWNLPDTFWAQQPDPDENTPAEVEDEMNERWMARLCELYFPPSLMNGAVPISDKGCANTHWLVITGPMSGTIWNDERADYKGVFPEAAEDGSVMTFGRWYERWIESGLSQGFPVPTTTAILHEPRKWWRFWK